MSGRALDDYMRGLSIEVRQQLFHHMRHEISETMVRWLAEKPCGYPSLRSCGFSDADIEAIGNAYAEKFERANQIVADNGRPPLFSDPRDSCQSAREHMELMKQRRE